MNPKQNILRNRLFSKAILHTGFMKIPPSYHRALIVSRRTKTALSSGHAFISSRNCTSAREIDWPHAAFCLDGASVQSTSVFILACSQRSEKNRRLGSAEKPRLIDVASDQKLTRGTCLKPERRPMVHSRFAILSILQVRYSLSEAKLNTWRPVDGLFF